MKISSFTLALLATAASAAFVVPAAGAQETNLQPIRAEMASSAPITGYHAWQLLGLETNLTARDVRLVLTTVTHDQYFRFRADRDMARQFAQSLGPERYTDLIAGLPVELHSPAVLEAARNMAASGAPNQGQRLDGHAVAVVASTP